MDIALFICGNVIGKQKIYKVRSSSYFYISEKNGRKLHWTHSAVGSRVELLTQRSPVQSWLCPYSILFLICFPKQKERCGV